ncbi:MAG: DUF1573 domain-containing protein [Tannerellaceae bacterium]|nr:DUF1573 domain-containing protein [Tannerellaceae bacterium]MCD8265446.1 DUF1573 domain-containing protein [Tannerellaceae bacterium]
MVGIQAQNTIRITSEQDVHDFGTILEDGGSVSHTFTIRNSGDAPLVITRVTTSCGCTTPAWTKEPIEPGKTGELQVTFNPKGRPGPFRKTISIFSNATDKRRHILTIKGQVSKKPLKLQVVYPYSIGNIKSSSKNIVFNTVTPDESVGEKIYILNEGSKPVSVRLGKTPTYLTADLQATELKTGQTSEINLVLQAKEAKRKGRINTELVIITEVEGEKPVSGTIDIAANLIDDFSKITSSEKAKAPVAQLSGTMLEFGKLPEKGGIIPLIGGKVSGTVEITNTGKSPLLIYSASSDNPILEVSGGKKEIKPGNSATFKISLRPRDIKTKLDAVVTIVCNDPNGPVRLVKVTAEK